MCFPSDVNHLVRTKMGDLYLRDLYELLRNEKRFGWPKRYGVYYYREAEEDFWREIYVDVVKGKRGQFTKITFDDSSTLELADNHQVLTNNKGWVNGDDLVNGDDVICLNGTFVQKATDWAKLTHQVTNTETINEDKVVYDVKMNSVNNYLVGGNVVKGM